METLTEKVAHISDYNGLVPRGGNRFAVVAGDYNSREKPLGYFKTVKLALSWMRSNGYSLPKGQPLWHIGNM